MSLNWNESSHRNSPSVRVSRAYLILLSSLLIGASACGSKSPPELALVQKDLPENPVPSDPGNQKDPTDPTDPNTLPQVIKGWLDSYSTYIENRVSRDYPAMLGVSNERMGTVCPKWSELDRGGREKFWSSLIWAIAGPESGRNRTAVYRETTMPIDPVTGQQVRSEGLLQLSYQDLVQYKYPEGDISWEKDRAAALADYVAGRAQGDPNRTILNAYSNLNLGVFIMNRLLIVYPSDSLEKAFGRYWSTMRSTNATFTKVMNGLKTRMPECF